jgi:hypothetical protein
MRAHQIGFHVKRDPTAGRAVTCRVLRPRVCRRTSVESCRWALWKAVDKTQGRGGQCVRGPGEETGAEGHGPASLMFHVKLSRRLADPAGPPSAHVERPGYRVWNPVGSQREFVDGHEKMGERMLANGGSTRPAFRKGAACRLVKQ